MHSYVFSLLVAPLVSSLSDASGRVYVSSLRPLGLILSNLALVRIKQLTAITGLCRALLVPRVKLLVEHTGTWSHPRLVYLGSTR